MRSRWGGWRVAGRIARRDAVRSRGRTALVAAMVALPVAAGAAIAVLSASSGLSYERRLQWTLGDDAQAVVQYFGGEVVQDQERGYLMADGTDDPLPRDEQAARVSEVLAGGGGAGPVVEVAAADVTVRTADAAPAMSLPAQAVPVDLLDELQGARLTAGRLPAADDEVALTPVWLDELDVRLGDRVALTVGNEVVVDDLAVVGTLAAVPDQADAVVVAGVLPADASALRLVVLGTQPVTWDDAALLNAAGFSVTTRYGLEHRQPPHPEFAQSGGGTDGSTVLLLGAALGFGLLEVVLLIGPAFAVGARRQQRQLALVAASGGDARTLRRIVLLGGVVVGGASAVLGAAAGLAIATGVRAVSRARGSWAYPDLRVPWGTVVLVAALGVLVAVAAAWLPARRVARLDVVAALAGRRSEPRLRRGTPVAALALVGVGAALVVLGAAGSPTPAIVGALLLQVGVVLAAGSAIALVARLAPRLGVAGRIALRDADRNRARTAPAVAAVVAAIAGSVAASGFVLALDDAHRAAYLPAATPGTVFVGQGFVDPSAPEAVDEDVSPGALAARAAALEDGVRAALPVSDAVVVRAPVPPDGATHEGATVWIEPRVAPGRECPLGADGAPTTRGVAPDDRVCSAGALESTAVRPGVFMVPGGGSSVALVDDGTVVRALGLPWSDEAADALAAGKVLVVSDRLVDADGRVWLDARVYRPTDESEPAPTTASAPGFVAPGLAAWTLVVPPAVAHELDVVASPVGVVARVDGVPTTGQENALRAALPPAAMVAVERGWTGDEQGFVRLLSLIAAIVGIGATGITVALGSVEFRPDLATLAAVGAAPRTRRRVAGAQGAVVVLLGSWLGVASGLLVAQVLVLARRARPANLADALLTLHVPWDMVGALTVAVPAVVVAGAWLLTRSRLPLARRAA